MTDRQLMERAVQLASQAAYEGEVPVGAVVARNGEIISEGRNRRENENNAVLHAEIEAIERACKSRGSWRLSGCELFVTLEPCPMCAGAVINSRIDRVVFGAYDENIGAAVSAARLFELPNGFRPSVVGGYMQEECESLLADFFKNRR